MSNRMVVRIVVRAITVACFFALFMGCSRTLDSMGLYVQSKEATEDGVEESSDVTDPDDQTGRVGGEELAHKKLPMMSIDPFEQGDVAGDEFTSGVIAFKTPAFVSESAHQHEFRVTAFAVEPSGLSAFMGTSSGEVLRVSLGSSKGVGRGKFRAKAELLFKGDRAVEAIAVSNTETEIAVSFFSSVIIFDYSSRQELRELSQVKGRIGALAWDPRGQMIALGRGNGDVFMWDSSQKKDFFNFTTSGIEQYGDAVSPIVRILFHPLARAFFSAEKDGRVTLWRTLRAEREIGIRDGFTLQDKRDKVAERFQFPAAEFRITDLAITSDAARVFAAVEGEIVERWKVRGLLREPPLRLADGAVKTLDVVELADPKLLLIVGAGRDQRLKFYCNVNASDGSSNGRDVADEIGILGEARSKKFDIVDEVLAPSLIETADGRETGGVSSSHQGQAGGTAASEGGAISVPSSLPPVIGPVVSPIIRTPVLTFPTMFVRYVPGGKVIWGVGEEGQIYVIPVDLLKSRLREIGFSRLDCS